MRFDKSKTLPTPDALKKLSTLNSSATAKLVTLGKAICPPLEANKFAPSMAVDPVTKIEALAPLAINELSVLIERSLLIID